MTFYEEIAWYQTIVHLLSNPVFQKFGIIGLFLNSILSATVLPIPVEITSTALVMGGENKLVVFAVWLAGSIIGGYINYGIGRGGHRLFDKLRHKARVETKESDKSQSLLAKYGWTIIFAAPWIPIVGDFINISAGVKRFDFRKFTIVMIAGKAFRIAVVVFLTGILFT